MFFSIDVSAYEYYADTLQINNAIFTNINCMGCTRSPYQLRSETINFFNLQMTNINYNAYLNTQKSLVAFFKFKLRKPYY